MRGGGSNQTSNIGITSPILLPSLYSCKGEILILVREIQINNETNMYQPYLVQHIRLGFALIVQFKQLSAKFTILNPMAGEISKNGKPFFEIRKGFYRVCYHIYIVITRSLKHTHTYILIILLTFCRIR